MKIRRLLRLYSNFFLETLKLPSSFSFTFCINLIYKIFWNMFLKNDEESAEAKGWTHKDLTLQKSTTAEVFPHVCQSDDYSASCPLLCMKLKSNSSLSIKACHPAHQNKRSTLTRATYVIPLECTTHIFIPSHLFCRTCSLCLESLLSYGSHSTHNPRLHQSPTTAMNSFLIPLVH